jgi:uncharacterized protein YjgD (DUF1641 family)
MNRERVRSVVLTLRLTQEEMLRLKISALSIGKKRGKIVRERLADLITALPAATPQATVVTVTEAVVPANTVFEPTAVEGKI